MRIFLILPLLVPLAACGAGLPQPPADVPPAQAVAQTGIPIAASDTCGAAQFAGLIGQPVGDAAAFRAAGTVFRVIYPGDAVTEDFSPQRLNIRTSAAGIIENLECS